MAEEGLRVGVVSSGLAVLLNEGDGTESSSRGHLVSYCDEFRKQSVEQTLEHIFCLPRNSLNLCARPVDSNLIHSIIKEELAKLTVDLSTSGRERDGIWIMDTGCGPDVVSLDVYSICGDIRIVKLPLLVESLAVFSSVRANACVWKGKWMYEVILETSGVQQLGWATLSCPFTDQKGVGDADDSYAFDGRRVRKWNKEAEPYGQSWVAGDVIGCCIDLDDGKISFYRNGISLGIAFDSIRQMEPRGGYYPATSLSQGERCEFNFGARPFRYPIKGYLPLQSPPLVNASAIRLLNYLSKLLDMQRMEHDDCYSAIKLRRMTRFVPLDDIFVPISRAICKEFFSIIEGNSACTEYIGSGTVLSFMMEIFRGQMPHDYLSLDSVLDAFLEFPESWMIFEHVIDALSRGCKTAPLLLTECPCSGPYPYLALACHMLRREKLMVLWWKTADFELTFEGFLSFKSPNREDLQCLMPSAWWPGSCDDSSCESSMLLTTTALSESINKIEEKHRELCRLVIQFIPPTSPPQLPGSIFRTFIQNIMLKNIGADRNAPLPGVSCNSILVSLYTVVLHFLSEGDVYNLLKNRESGSVGFLHRGGQRSFPVTLFLNDKSHRSDVTRLGGSYSHLSKSHPVDRQEEELISWEEGCMDDSNSRITHLTLQKPCCCSNSDVDYARSLKNPIRYAYRGSPCHAGPVQERSTHVTAECSASNLDDEITDKPSTSDQSEPEFGYRSMQHIRTYPRDSNISSATIREEELLDALLLLYHLGLAPNFKQASYYNSQQSQFVSLLEETEKQIREQVYGEKLKRLKEARIGYREEIANCVRHCAWYRVLMFSRWKQRGMYATCMWTVQLLLAFSRVDTLFLYVPEYYIESLVDCFHVLRKSDPPFVPPTMFIKRGLSSFVTFLVTHFNDPRISSADLRDLLLQSISVLVQYKEFLDNFENNEAATKIMPAALLSAFDNRSWISVTNILLRLCKGSGFGFSKYGESSSSSMVFQRLLREACINDESLFSAFLNRLFNTLSWTMTEFSISVREMQEEYQVSEFHQRKCGIIFDLSCNLARVLEFCTREIPQAFLSGEDTNLQRLTEFIVFSLNHITSAADAEFFELSAKRHGQLSEKMNRGMLLAPLAGIILNLLDACGKEMKRNQSDIINVFASTDCFGSVCCGFQYLLKYNWAESFKANVGPVKLRKLDRFLSLLMSESKEPTKEKSWEEMGDFDEQMCCICYASEADTEFIPCYHRSCYGCISRHLLNCQRCFFCNATVSDFVGVQENRSL
ncbi:hypothetical protein SAY86_026426 [Trapa natans]|uniref:RING-type E3 ubiquitin transferase n=1 Tax=Trapa natans TaxID=22666 RepID=A0AAN7KJS1_TRANT|nr:hypothetical protein SAY86_026426 [Trapa natans]